MRRSKTISEEQVEASDHLLGVIEKEVKVCNNDEKDKPICPARSIYKSHLIAAHKEITNLRNKRLGIMHDLERKKG